MDLALYPRDCWYMIGWDADFPAGQPVAVTALGRRIAVWRTGCSLFAVEDRCPHRGAPLSLGRCEGEDLRCMYHGLLFAGDGRCREVPGQDRIPPQAAVQAYPVIERSSAVWLWPGDPQRADPALVPDFVGYRHDDWALTPGRLDYAAPAKLIHDNLLDLSHISYVHEQSFAGNNPAVADKWRNADTVSIALPRGVRVERWIEGMPANDAGGGKGTGGGDIFSAYDFLLPGVFLQVTERFPPHTRRNCGGERAGLRSLMSTFTCQAVLPIDEERACYFFAYGPWRAESDRREFFATLGLKAFEEDRRMIEAQWQVLRQSPGWRPLPLAMDQALVKYEAIVKRQLREERGRPDATMKAGVA